MDHILNRFENVTQSGSNGSTRYQCMCPCHKDKKPSLSISKKDGKWLLHCHAGCNNDDILRAVNLTWNDLAEEGFIKEEVAIHKKTYSTWDIEKKSQKVYEYVNKDNEPYILIARSYKKDFFQYSYAGGKKWYAGLNGNTPVLYHLPEVIQAVNNGETIYIVEGEKDADNLKALGLTSTTSPMGAGKWRSDYNQYLKDAIVVIIPDNDSPGIKHAEDVANNLFGIAKEIKIINLPALQEKQDVSDWLQSEGTKEKLLELVNNTPAFVKKANETTPLHAPEEATKPSSVTPLKDYQLEDFLKIKYPKVKYLIQDILPEGLSILAGAPKIGKTFFALNMALSIASGTKTLGILQTEKTGVAYFALDEKDQFVQEKINSIIQAQGLTHIPDNFRLIFDINKMSEGGYEQITSYLDEHPDIKLLIIDTMGRIRKPAKLGNAYEQDVESIGQIQSICNKKNVSILLIHHLKKGRHEDYIENLSGSMGISGTVDTILHLDRGRGEQEGNLKVTGRLIKEEQDLAIKFHKDLLNWQILGNSTIYSQSKERQEIINLLLEEGTALKDKEIAEILGKSYDTIRKTTYRMYKDGLLVNVSRGKYFLSSSLMFKINSSSPSVDSSPNSPGSLNEVIETLNNLKWDSNMDNETGDEKIYSSE
ncbi:MAG: AAA family ATPase, partial [Nitrospirota bacterium]